MKKSKWGMSRFVKRWVAMSTWQQYTSLMLHYISLTQLHEKMTLSLSLSGFFSLLWLQTLMSQCQTLINCLFPFTGALFIPICFILFFLAERNLDILSLLHRLPMPYGCFVNLSVKFVVFSSWILVYVSINKFIILFYK